MIELDKQGTPITDATGKIIGYNTQRVKKPNSFFLNPGIVFDWNSNTFTSDGDTYYLDNSVLQTAETTSIPTKEEWLNTYGNYIKYEKFDFIDSKNNPSGNSKNIYRALYYDTKDRVKYIFEYSWDADDVCVSVKSLAPEGAEAEVEKTIVYLHKYSNSVLIDTLKSKQGETLYVAALADRSSVKASFRGWRISGGSMLPMNENGAYYIVMDQTYDIEAVWVFVKTVTLYSKGSLVSINSMDEGTSYIPETLDDTDTETFEGWALLDDATEAIYPKGTEITVDDDMILYAVWKTKSETE